MKSYISVLFINKFYQELMVIYYLTQENKGWWLEEEPLYHIDKIIYFCFIYHQFYQELKEPKKSEGWWLEGEPL